MTEKNNDDSDDIDVNNLKVEVMPVMSRKNVWKVTTEKNSDHNDNRDGNCESNACHDKEKKRKVMTEKNNDDSDDSDVSCL